MMPRGGRIWQAHEMCGQSILLLLFWLSCCRPRGLGGLARNTLIWPVLSTFPDRGCREEWWDFRRGSKRRGEQKALRTLLLKRKIPRCTCLVDEGLHSQYKPQKCPVILQHVDPQDATWTVDDKADSPIKASAPESDHGRTP